MKEEIQAKHRKLCFAIGTRTEPPFLEYTPEHWSPRTKCNSRGSEPAAHWAGGHPQELAAPPPAVCESMGDRNCACHFPPPTSNFYETPIQGCKEKRVRVKLEQYRGYQESQVIYSSAHSIQIPQPSKHLESQISPTGQMQQVAQLCQDFNSAHSFPIHRNVLHDF